MKQEEMEQKRRQGAQSSHRGAPGGTGRFSTTREAYPSRSAIPFFPFSMFTLFISLCRRLSVRYVFVGIFIVCFYFINVGLLVSFNQI